MKLPSELTRILIIRRPLRVSKYLQSTQDPKLHIGCGPNYQQGWLNADKFDSRADIYLNAYNKMPFGSDTFKYLYSEHTLEHLKITKVKFFLEECLRILKPGGVFRLTVPDLELLATKYVEKDAAFFAPYLNKYEPIRKNGIPKYWMVRSPGGVLNTLGTRHFFHHRWFYDFDTLEGCCREVGFSKVTKWSFNQSKVATLANMDRASRQHETLYIELMK